MEIFVLLIVSILCIFSILNFFTARSIKHKPPLVNESVSILIPMRNEALNALAVVNSSLSQSKLSNLRVMALDDSSSDETGRILATISDKRFSALPGEELPSGWLGKNFALHCLASNTNSEYLVFIDADVRLESEAVAASIDLMNQLGWDYISPYPRQVAHGALARMVQPLLQWSWFATLPLRLVENSRLASTVVANGQFFIVRNKAYRHSGGHEAVKGEVLDDLELARSLRRHGSRGSVVDASHISSCEMYRNSAELVAGYSKSQWRAFGGTLGAIFAVALLFTSSVLPAFMMIKLEPWAIASYIALVLSRVLAALRTRSVIATAPLHPIAIFIWIVLILRSLTLKRMGKLQWRGRSI
jgi:glycosyltransferase involved in cell wall biosynthesis